MFLGINILFNYFYCVTTNPGTHDSEAFKRLVEQAVVAGDLPPDTLNIDSGIDDDGNDDNSTKNLGVNDSDMQPLLNNGSNNVVMPSNEIRNRVANDINTTPSYSLRSKIINTEDARNKKDEP